MLKHSKKLLNLLLTLCSVDILQSQQCTPSLSNILDQQSNNRDEFGVVNLDDKGFKIQIEGNSRINAISSNIGCSFSYYFFMSFDTDNDTRSAAPYKIVANSWNRVKISGEAGSHIFWFYSWTHVQCGVPDFIVHTNGNEYIESCNSKNYPDYISKVPPPGWRPPPVYDVIVNRSTATLSWTHDWHPQVTDLTFDLYRSPTLAGQQTYYATTSSLSKAVTDTGLYFVYAKLSNVLSKFEEGEDKFVQYPPP